MELKKVVRREIVKEIMGLPWLLKKIKGILLCIVYLKKKLWEKTSNSNL